MKEKEREDENETRCGQEKGQEEPSVTGNEIQ